MIMQFDICMPFNNLVQEDYTLDGCQSKENEETYTISA